jgi:hypothetical protein
MTEANRQAILDVVIRLLADRRLDSSQVLGALMALVDRAQPPAAISDLVAVHGVFFAAPLAACGTV